MMKPSQSSPTSYRVETVSILALMILLGALMLSLTMEPGVVNITEFSPDRLSFRHRSYFCYPFLGIDGEEESTPLLDRVLEFDDGGEPAKSPPRWNFVSGDKPRTRGWHGAAKHAHYLFRPNNDWLDWTDKNPELAKRFWPKIIHWLRQEKYSQVTVAAMLARDAQTLADVDLAFAEAAKE